MVTERDFCKIGNIAAQMDYGSPKGKKKLRMVESLLSKKIASVSDVTVELYFALVSPRLYTQISIVWF